MLVPHFLLDLLQMLLDRAVPAAFQTLTAAGVSLRHEGGTNFHVGGRTGKWVLWTVVLLTLPQLLSWVAAQGNLALKLGVPVLGGGLKEGIEVFPKQDEIKDGEYGNAIRAPMGVHRKTNRRYWFYDAALAPEPQLAYLNGLKKLSEGELKTFIQGMSLPEAYKPPVSTPYISRT